MQDTSKSHKSQLSFLYLQDRVRVSRCSSFSLELLCKRNEETISSSLGILAQERTLVRIVDFLAHFEGYFAYLMWDVSAHCYNFLTS